MAKGDGTIQNTGRNEWHVFVSLGIDPVTGKYRRVSRRVQGTQADARRVRDELVAERDSGLRFDAQDTTFGEYSRDWCDYRESRGELKTRSYKKERAQVEVFCSYIGNVKMKDVTPYGVKNLLSRIKSDRGIGNSTLNDYYGLLGRIFEEARKDRIIMVNPVKDVDAPKRDDKKRGSLDEEEGARLLAFVDQAESEAYEALADKEERQASRDNVAGRVRIYGIKEISCILAVRIGLETGMRRGEILALRWGDVSVRARRISVEHSYSQEGGLEAPKTDAGNRTLYVDEATAKSLSKWKLAQKMELATLGIVQGKETPVCCSGTGAFLDPQHFENWWRKFRVEAGFPDLKFHELRHTQATLLLGNGFDVKTVQTRMGHSSASFTLDRYAHALPKNDKEAANFMGDLFGKEDGQQFKAVKTA